MADVLDEWVESIEAMYTEGDDDLTDRVKSFATRLKLAGDKLDAIGVPQPVTPKERPSKHEIEPPASDDDVAA